LKAEDERSANKAAAAIQKRMLWLNSKSESENNPTRDADQGNSSDIVTSIQRVEISSSANTTTVNTSDSSDQLAVIKQSNKLMIVLLIFAQDYFVR
jgi:hypothetical protein